MTPLPRRQFIQGSALAAVLAYTKGEAISKELVKAIVGIEPEEDV